MEPPQTTTAVGKTDPGTWDPSTSVTVKPGPRPAPATHQAVRPERLSMMPDPPPPPRQIKGGLGTSRPPQYQAAPSEAPGDPPTPPNWQGAPRDEAPSRKRRRSSPTPARRTHPRRSCSPQCHSASAAHSGRSRSPRRHHARHGRPMSTSPSPHEPHRAYRSPRPPYASSTPSPRNHRSRSPRRRHASYRCPMSTFSSPHSRTPSSDPPPPRPPPTSPGGLPLPCGSLAAG